MMIIICSNLDVQKTPDLDAGCAKTAGGKAELTWGVNEHFSPAVFAQDAPNMGFSEKR